VITGNNKVEEWARSLILTNWGGNDKHVRKKIKSIEIKNASCGLCSPDEIISEALIIYRKGKIKHLQYNGVSDKPVNEYEYKVDKNMMDAFFDMIVTKIKIQDWKDDYSVEVYDGYTWECKIRCPDNTIKKVVGTVEPPPSGKRLRNLINKLTDFKVKPWIL